MGAGTALAFATAGHKVFLWGRSEESLQKGMKSIKDALASLISNGIIDKDREQTILASITPTTDMEVAAKDADWVMESIAEDLTVKQELFAKLDKICPKRTIFATNTSALSPTEIARPLSKDRKERFVVAHGFNPPHLMPVVEVVPGEQTSEDTIVRTCDLFNGASKKAIRLDKEYPGFIVNRVQAAILFAAFKLLEDGVASAEKIDDVVERTIGKDLETKGPLDPDMITQRVHSAAGTVEAKIETNIRKAMNDAASHIYENGIASPEQINLAVMGTLGRRLAATGPLRSADMGGLDIFKSIFYTLGLSIPKPMAEAVDAGHLGLKTGQGIYLWDDETRKRYTQRRVDGLVRHLKLDAA